MYLTQTNVIRGLSQREYFLLGEMCRYANSLYNVTLYNIRQHWFDTKKFLRYEANYYEVNSNENYKMLQAGVSQQIMRVVDRSFKSFFNLLKKCRQNEYRFQDVKMPAYQKSGSMFPLILSKNAISITHGIFNIPMSQEFKKRYSKGRICIKFPQRLVDKEIKEVRILPCRNGRFFKIQYVYIARDETLDLNKSNMLGIDLGGDNFAACVPTNGTPFIMDGRKLKSINHRWNKEKARLQSIADKQGTKHTERIDRITEKRNNQVKDQIRKTARYIINYCIEHDIGTLVIGYNEDFKRRVKMGRRNNQTFAQISFGDLRITFRNLCERYGMDYIEQEESYTSKSSFLDDDVLPKYIPEQPYKGSFKGKRVKRGLYRTSNGTHLNADVNGAANILRKATGWSVKDLPGKGFLDNPLRIRLT